MIRFKKSVAADVPVPAAGYVTLFVDSVTGQPSAKDSAGVVVSLKGTDGDDATGVPEGGTPGQVVTKTEGGAAWADAPVGGEPAGTWISLLPPDGECNSLADDSVLTSALVSGIVSGEGSLDAIGFNLTRSIIGDTATRLRCTATLLLDVAKVDTEADGVGGYQLEITDSDSDDRAIANLNIIPGSNVIDFDIPIPADSDSFMDSAFAVRCYDASNVASAWASLEVTQFDVLVSTTSTVETTPLEMTPIVFQGIRGGGSGGFHVVKEGALAEVTDIEIVGYYNTAKYYEVTRDELYAPRWIDEADYVALGAPIALTPGSPDWSDGHLSDLPDMSGLPDFDPNGDDWDSNDNYTLCKVTLDGGAPVLAMINNGEGT